MARNPLRDVHWPLLGSIMGLSAISILFIYSSSHHEPGQFEIKQMVWIAIGFAVFFSVAMIGYKTFLSMSYLLYVISLFLLVWVMLAGQVRYGARLWIVIGPLVIQPSEFSKLATVLAVAQFLGTDYGADQKNGKSILVTLILVLIPLVMIMRQPDLGTSVIFIPMAIVLLFAWGIRFRILAAAGSLVLLAAPVLWLFLKEYQKKRILVFLNPKLDPLGAGYTAIQSKVAIGSGGLLGKGFLNGTQSQLNFVPEHHTDFIFCVVGEEWGFVGSMLLLGLYAVLFQAIFHVIAHTTDIRAKLLASGILAILFAQIFINIGMSIGLMPITGLTLPLVSYGGSSFVTTMAALGLIYSIHRERSIF